MSADISGHPVTHTAIFFFVFLVVVLSTQLCGVCADAFYDEQINSEWQTVRLHCSNTTPFQQYPNHSFPIAWMLPNLTVVNVSSSKYEIDSDFWSLQVNNATADDIGVYHCMMQIQNTSDLFLVKLGLNAGGPYFENLTKKYEMNIIIGFSAAFGFLLLFLAVYFFYIWFLKNLMDRCLAAPLSDTKIFPMADAPASELGGINGVEAGKRSGEEGEGKTLSEEGRDHGGTREGETGKQNEGFTSTVM